MRLCVAIPCFFKSKQVDFCDALRTIASLGYDAAETYDWQSLDLPRVRQTLDETGVELLSMCTTEMRLTDPTYRTAFLDGLQKTCEAAKTLGVKRLITQVGADTGEPRELQHRSIVEGLRAATPILDTYGITLMIEPLNTLVDHKGYYLTASAEAFDIIHEVAHPYVKVIYDVYHQQVMEGNIIPSITQNLDCIAHLHAAGHPGRHELQYGENDYHVILDAVDRAGYTGAIGLEYKPLLDPIESLRLARQIYGA